MKRRLVVALSALLSLCGIQNVAAQTINLRYGQIPSTIKTVSALQFYIAQRKGFFAREGINLEMLPIDGGAANMVVALSKGMVDITRTATPYLIQDVLKGSENVAIAGETATPIYSLIVKPEIKSFADLHGKTVGLSLAVDTISISSRKLMAMNGVKEGDFKVKELVGTPARAQCLTKGDCDAVPLGQPEDFNLIKQGYRRLGVSTDAMSNFQFIVGAVRRSWGEKTKRLWYATCAPLRRHIVSCATPAFATRSCALSSRRPVPPKKLPGKRYRFISNLSAAWCPNKARSTSRDLAKSSKSWAKPAS